jgi:putative spermidine/putrescine transport system ATP-binding protein
MNALPLVSSLDLSHSHLALDGVSKIYRRGSEPVVKDVSFTLGQGQFMTLLGPSGSGKTTTLMMVAGFESPTSGRILAHGQDISAIPANRRNFGVVFQGYALFPHMSVQDNVEFALRMRRVDPAARRKRALDMLDKVGLAAFAARRPRELSGGQQQRVALARALAFEPDLLLLDEPLGALDKKMRETLQGEIKRIQRNTGVSVLFITHDQSEAMMMSDVVGVMENGRVVQIGSPEAVYNHPVDRFVATFLGEANLIPCEPCGLRDGLVEARLDGGQTVLARPPSGTLPKRALLSLRPERLKLLDATDAADHVVEAEVLERVFLGQQVRYTLRGLGQTLIAIEAGQAGFGSGGGPGAKVRVGWSRDAGQLLGDDHQPS